MAGVSDQQPKKNKVVNKSAKKVSNKKKIRKTKRKDDFRLGLVRLSKCLNPDLQLSSKSISVLNSFMSDMFIRLTSEASRLVKIKKAKTLTSREIQTATKLIMVGQLAQYAVLEGTRAVKDCTTKK